MHIKSSVILLSFLLALMLGACQLAGPAQNNTPSPSPETPATAAPEIPETPLPPAAALAARELLAERLNLSLDQVDLVDFAPEEWPNACLGYQQPDESCAEVITPGFRVILEVDGQRYELHTDQTGDNIRLDPALQTAGAGEVQLYLVALEDNGQSGEMIGCGDSLVPVEQSIEPTADPIAAAMTALLAINEEFYGESGLYNALHQSDLTVESATIDDEGRATVHLTGDYSLGGVCDTPRFEAQLEATARQFPAVQEVAIFLNDQPLDEALSLRGEGPYPGVQESYP